jgi:predicted nucleotidyltransferase
MNPSCPNKVNSFLNKVKEWAKTQPDLLALALIGSHARGEAKTDSDIDLILLTSNPEEFFGNPEWIAELGSPVQIVKEDWGKVTSLRVFFADDLEVEFGITDQSWASFPLDSGTQDVINDGMNILFERKPILSTLSMD